MQQQVLLTGRSRTLHGRLWTNGSNVTRGVVIAVHGMGDHSDRFSTVAQALSDVGWSLFAFDLQGHGRSPGPRGKVDSYDGVLDDIAAARSTVRDQLGDVSHVLLGHSMGGNLVLNYALRESEFHVPPVHLAGLALVSPMILPPDPPQRPHIFAAWLTGRLIPWLRFGKPVDKDKLSSNEDEASRIEEDSFTHAQVSIRLATELLAQGRWAIDHAREIEIPTLIMHGDDDQLIDNSACEHLAVRIGDQAEYVRWPEMRHALFQETDRDRVIERLIQWLDKSVILNIVT